MPPFLQVIEGPAQGRKLEVQTGRVVTVGRTTKAMIAFAEDEWMSGLHFSVALRNGILYFGNLSKSNGTQVNEQKLEEAALKPGDRVKAGQTVFEVVGAEPNPFPARFRVGGWGFENVPPGWNFVEGTGFHHSEIEPFRASMLAVEEPLPKDFDLAAYVKLQIELGQKHINGADFKGPVEAKVAGAEQALALSMTAPTEAKGQARQHQIYAAHKGAVGVFTATALESQGPLLREAVGTVLKGLSFFQS